MNQIKILICLFMCTTSFTLTSSAYTLTQEDGVTAMDIDDLNGPQLATLLRPYYDILSEREKADMAKRLDGSLGDTINALQNYDGPVRISSKNKDEVMAFMDAIEDAKKLSSFVDPEKLDSNKFLEIMQQAKAGCGPKDGDKGMEQMYYALALIASNKSCNIKSIKMPDAGGLTRSLSLSAAPAKPNCIVETHKEASGSIGVGSLDIVGTDSATNTLSWNADHRIAAGGEMTVREWLLGNNNHKGFVRQLQEKKFCDPSVFQNHTGGDNTGVKTNN